MCDAGREEQRWGNRLVTAIAATGADRFHAALERVSLPAGMVLVEPGMREEYAYFPDEGVVCLLSMLDGEMAETATVGSEGVIGLGALLGDPAGRHQAIVQIAGSGVRIPIATLRGLIRGNPEIEALLHRYIRCFLVQVQQSVVCNSLHSVRDRCARWLLMAHDRATGDGFALTHRALAEMLGIRRPSVTHAARSLQDAGLIRYTYGTVTITDRDGLEEASCPCYHVVRDTFDALLGPPQAKSGNSAAGSRPKR